jgi:hypothetical protein
MLNFPQLLPDVYSLFGLLLWMHLAFIRVVVLPVEVCRGDKIKVLSMQGSDNSVVLFSLS